MEIGGVVLAAGLSARMARPKLLLPFRGHPLLWHAVSCMAGAPVRPVVCVLGHGSAEITSILRTYTFPQPVLLRKNEGYASGRASSVRVGIESLPESCAGAVFLPGDMPLLRSEDVGALVERYERTGAPIVVAVDEAGNRAHPVLFARSLFPRLAALTGDESGHGLILESWPEVEKVTVPRRRVVDVDTEEAYRRLLESEGEP
ncbi:MAG: nucleotidyltransferase family protein [Hyphomicrobiales bacterium]